jgi:Domain of unknown function (DUF4156)
VTLLRSLAVALPALLLSACAPIPIVPGAERIKLTNQEPTGCENLGEVVGTQGNMISGGWTSNESLVLGARNDLKNKAQALGANVVHLLTNTTGQASGRYGGSTTSSHLLGTAYRCP